MELDLSGYKLSVHNTVNLKSITVDGRIVENQPKIKLSAELQSSNPDFKYKTVCFENELNRFYDFLRSKLVDNDYVTRILYDTLISTPVTIQPDVRVEVNQPLKYCSFNTVECRQKTISGKKTTVPYNSIQSSLYNQNENYINKLNASISSIFQSNISSTENGVALVGNTDMYLSSYVFQKATNKNDSSSTPGFAADATNNILLQDEIKDKITLNTKSLYFTTRNAKPGDIVNSNYVINKLYEFIYTLEKIKLFNYKAFLKKLSYSGKVVTVSFINTEAVNVQTKINSYGTVAKRSIGVKQYVKKHAIISPYIRAFKEYESGITLLADNTQNFKQQNSSATFNASISLNDDAVLIYTEDEQSDIPSFDFSDMYGSNGVFSFYREIQTEKCELANKIDLSQFGIESGKLVYAKNVVMAIYYIFRMWLANIKTYYCIHYFCHSNCHNDNVLVQTKIGSNIRIVYADCVTDPYLNDLIANIISKWNSDHKDDADYLLPQTLEIQTKTNTTPYTDIGNGNAAMENYPMAIGQLAGTLTKDVKIRNIFKDVSIPGTGCDNLIIMRRNAFPAAKYYEKNEPALKPLTKMPGYASPSKYITLSDRRSIPTSKAIQLRNTIYHNIPTGGFWPKTYFADRVEDGRYFLLPAMKGYPNGSSTSLQLPDPNAKSGGNYIYTKESYGLKAQEYFTNWIYQNKKAPYGLDTISDKTLYLKFDVYIRNISYTIYYKSNNITLKTVNRALRYTDNRPRIYIYSQPNLDGCGRPCFVVCLSDIEPYCKRSILNITIEWGPTGDRRSQTVTKNGDQLSSSQGFHYNANSETYKHVILRQYLDGIPAPATGQIGPAGTDTVGNYYKMTYYIFNLIIFIILI